MNKYKEGDLVTIRLDKKDAEDCSNGIWFITYPYQIVKHEKAPEPTFIWANVYKDFFTLGTADTEQEIDKYANPDRLAKLKITIIGDIVEAEVIK